MDSIRQYIICIVGVAVCCGIIRCFMNEKSTIGGLIKTLCGIVLAIAAISPVLQIRYADLKDYTDLISTEAAALSQDGADLSNEKLGALITQKLEAYILEKASLLDCDVEVHISINKESPPEPSGVKITGAVSPYAKARLCDMIETDLGIPKEMQQWIYQN